MSSHVLGAGNDDPLYTDASITLTVTPDSDLSSANAIRAYIVGRGDRVQWGSDQSGVSADTEVTAKDEPETLSLNGSPIDGGRYTVQWVYEDGNGDVDTIAEHQIHFTDPE